MTTAPYGPATAVIRRFLVRLAALGPVARAAVAGRFDAISRTARYREADTAVADTIDRSGRVDARDALAGPLLQLMRVAPPTPGDVAPSPVGNDDDEALDPMAEAALAALLALLLRDLLSDEHFHALYDAFEPDLPLSVVTDV